MPLQSPSPFSRPPNFIIPDDIVAVDAPMARPVFFRYADARNFHCPRDVAIRITTDNVDHLSRCFFGASFYPGNACYTGQFNVTPNYMLEADFSWLSDQIGIDVTAYMREINSNQPIPLPPRRAAYVRNEIDVLPLPG